MAEILQNELDQPKDINEGAVLEMINLWKAYYKPDSTVDPTSDGAVSGKAVYDAIQSMAGVGKNISFTDNSYKNFDQDGRGTLIDVTKYIKRVGSVSVLDVKFVPRDTYKYLGSSQSDVTNAGGMNTRYIACDFDNRMFRLEPTPTTAEMLTAQVRALMTRGVQCPLFAGRYANLEYTFHHVEDQARSSFTKIFRTAMAFTDYADGKTYLYLSGTNRSYIDGTPDGTLSARVKVNTNATEEECQKCTISRIVVF